ncbi:MAG: hypothetical protein KJS97_13870 [Alphaproteobacteria bacterium]|nr:hypothetical protein [Alphaproteobacteria bacterium]
MFSPYYKAARTPAPEDHCAINVAVYGRPGRWAMTERGRGDLARTPDLLRVGPSAMSWSADGLRIDLNELCTPVPVPLRGVVHVRPRVTTDLAFALDADARHIWRPIAPLADVEVQLDAPRLAWRGAGYLDANWGAEPLAAGFKSWSWARTAARDHAEVQFDVARRDGSSAALAIRIDADGAMTTDAPAPLRALPPGFWGVARPVAAHTPPRLAQVWEDTPFYTRSKIALDAADPCAATVHESLDLDRFESAWVQALLGFRMPRRVSRPGPRPARRQNP